MNLFQVECISPPHGRAYNIFVRVGVVKLLAGSKYLVDCNAPRCRVASSDGKWWTRFCYLVTLWRKKLSRNNKKSMISINKSMIHQKQKFPPFHPSTITTQERTPCSIGSSTWLFHRSPFYPQQKTLRCPSKSQGWWVSGLTEADKSQQSSNHKPRRILW